MKKSTLSKLIIALTLFCLLSFGVQAQSVDSTLILDELVQKVLAQNPKLKASYEDWKASETRIPQEKSLPDPTLGINFMNLPVNSFAFDQEPMTGKQISIMQPFPFPGKLGIKGEIARSSSEMSLQQYRELQNQLVKETRQVYYDLFYIDKALATVASNQELLREFVDIAETRYSVGNGRQQDVLRAQVALSKMIDRELKLRQQRESIQARINTLINEPADDPLGKAIVPEFKKSSIQLDSLIQIATRENPLLAAWKSVIKRSEQQVDLAQKNRYPDFSVGLAYTQRDDLQSGMKAYDFVSAMFNIKIPLYSKTKQSKKVQEAQIGLTSMEHRYQEVENSIERNLQEALTNLEKNQRLIELYETGIIPQAEESLESSIFGYQNDQVDFLSLLDSELTLFQFQLDYHRYLADYYKNLAEITALTGTEF